MIGVGVFPQPFRYFLFLSYYSSYLKIAVDDVHVSCSSQVGEVSVVVCGMSEPPVVEEDVADSDVVVIQFCEGASFLPECRHPSLFPLSDFFSEVRIQMAMAVGVDEGFFVQLSDDVAERGSFPSDFRERDVVV